jgi:hypothetical protein
MKRKIDIQRLTRIGSKPGYAWGAEKRPHFSERNLVRVFSMDIENLEEVEVRGYDSPALAFEDKLARKIAKQIRLLRSLENLGRNMKGTTQALRDFSNLVKKK